MSEAYKTSLETLKHRTQMVGMTSILLWLPRLDPDVRYLSGRRPDLEHYDRLAEIARQGSEGWATYLAFDDIVAAAEEDKSACMAVDRMHPNARGHQLIAEALIPIIDRVLDVRWPMGADRPAI